MSNNTQSVLDSLSKNSTNLLITGLENMIWPILVIAFVVFSVLLPQLFVSGDNISFIVYSGSAMGLRTTRRVDLPAQRSLRPLGRLRRGLFGHVRWPLHALLVSGDTRRHWDCSHRSSRCSHRVAERLPSACSALTRSCRRLRSTLSSARASRCSPRCPSRTCRRATSISAVTNSVPYRVATILLVALFLIACFALKYTRTGIAIYSVGGDKDAAREAGINTTQIVLLVYVLSGALAGLAGLIYTGYLGAVTPTLASGALFPAFAAAVIGGISLFGGRGNILGGLGGVLLLSTIQAGLVMLGIDPKLVKVINGVILLGAVLLYTGEAQLRRRLLTE